GLEAAAGVAGAVMQHRVADLVGEPRLQLLEAGILAADPLARDEADPPAALFQRGDQVREEGGIVLAVTVERRHHGAMRGTDSAADRSGLPRRPLVAQNAQVRPPRHLLGEALRGLVGRAVI